jgi:hypothetical protein
MFRHCILIVFSARIPRSGIIIIIIIIRARKTMGSDETEGKRALAMTE